MEKRYVLALDQGTTSSRAILFDREQNIVGSVSREFPQIYPKEGWVEHDPADIWSSQYGCMTKSSPGAARNPGRSRRSGSPISGRPPSSGTGRRERPSREPSSGSAAGPRIWCAS